MPYQKLDPNAVRMWRISRLIGLIVLLAAEAGLILFLTHQNDLVPSWLEMPWMLAAAMILPVLQMINLLVYPPVEYRQWSYLIDADRIEIRKGIFFHTTQIIPISRIQHVTVSEGPLARHFHLAGVTIHTAGGLMKIEGLAQGTAAGICENLKTVVNRKVGLSQPSAEGRG